MEYTAVHLATLRTIARGKRLRRMIHSAELYVLLQTTEKRAKQMINRLLG